VAHRIVVAIDGPAGAGKSTLAKMLAQELGYTYIDTGAMYRAVGLLAREQGVDAEDGAALSRLAQDMDFRFAWEGARQRVRVGERDVSDAIRSLEAAADASRVSRVPELREALVALQRHMGLGGGVVMEGRDIGTVVFPRAELKVFLTASARERGHRRWAELRAKGEEADLQDVIAQVEARDLADSTRAVAPLRPAADAVIVDTSELRIDRVLQALLRLAKAHAEGVAIPTWKEG
jgi:cytidylate kinase